MNIPEGWKLVPVEPIEEMIDRGGREIAFKMQHFGGAHTLMHYSSPEIEMENRLRAVYSYRVMLAFAPTPPAQEDEPVGFLWRDKQGKEEWRFSSNVKDAADADLLKYTEIRLVYFRPDSELRKEVESLIALSDRWGNQMPYGIKAGIENLRAALNKGES